MGRDRSPRPLCAPALSRSPLGAISQRCVAEGVFQPRRARCFSPVASLGFAHEVSLGSANHSGALAVYDYLGFTTVGQSRLYAMEI